MHLMGSYKYVCGRRQIQAAPLHLQHGGGLDLDLRPFTVIIFSTSTTWCLGEGKVR